MTKRTLLSICFFFAIFLLYSQHQEPIHHHQNKSHFRVSIGLAHTYLPEETADGTKNLILPSFALDIEYWINHHWGIGLHNDLELLNFEVKDEDQVFIEREFPVLLTLDALWKPNNNLVLFVGPGVELESQKNYFVFRAGCEYEIPFFSNWDLSPLVFYDMRDGAYNTLTIGLGVGFRFNLKKTNETN
jgi:hypothetical protein